MSEPLLQVRDLRVDFVAGARALHAVRGVSFDIEAGQTLALLGESGSGKSVTSAAIMGLLPPGAGQVTGGSITFGGRDVLGMPPAERRRLRGADMAMIFQDQLSSLNPVQTVGHQIDEMFRRHRRASRRAAREQTLALMHRVRIPDPLGRADSYPHEFSGGMRQRIMIAMAIALEPRLLIADEPTTALDVTVQAQIVELLTELRAERGMALLFISHDLGVVAPFAERVAVMYAGRIVEHGPTREVYDAPRHPYTAGLLRSLPDVAGGRARLEQIPGNPPDIRLIPAGCAFAARCSYAQPRCQQETPPLAPAGPGRLSACIRAGELAGTLAAVAGAPAAPPASPGAPTGASR